MGAYQCYADNGIPPAANATFYVEVHCMFFILNAYIEIDIHSYFIVAPLVLVRNQYLYASEGGSVSLECEVSFVYYFKLFIAKLEIKRS